MNTHDHTIPLTIAVVLIAFGLLALAGWPVTNPLSWIVTGAIVFIFAMWHDRYCEMK
jgi:fatty acid desaturase